MSVYPRKELPFFIVFTAALCSFTAALALLTHQYPDAMGSAARSAVAWLAAPVQYLLEKAENVLPATIMQSLTKM